MPRWTAGFAAVEGSRSLPRRWWRWQCSMLAAVTRRRHQSEMRRCWSCRCCWPRSRWSPQPLVAATKAKCDSAGRCRCCWPRRRRSLQPLVAAVKAKCDSAGRCRCCWPRRRRSLQPLVAAVKTRCSKYLLSLSALSDTRPPTLQLNIVRAQRAGSRARAAVRRVAGKLVGGRGRARWRTCVNTARHREDGRSAALDEACGTLAAVCRGCGAERRAGRGQDVGRLVRRRMLTRTRCRFSWAVLGCAAGCWPWARPRA